MDRRSFLVIGTAAACLPALRAQMKDSKLIVQVTYTGSGTVDGAHRIYIALWDTPNFVNSSADGPPLDTNAVASKTADAQFEHVHSNPVYLSLVYDPSGSYDGTAAPTSGCFLGFYSTQPGVPAPISLQPGKTTTVTAKLDDSFKMP